MSIDSSTAARLLQSRALAEKRACRVCGTDFAPTSVGQRYCSPKCKYTANAPARKAARQARKPPQRENGNKLFRGQQDREYPEAV